MCSFFVFALWMRKLFLDKTTFLWVCISRPQVRIEHYLSGASLVIWKCIKLSDISWLSLGNKEATNTVTLLVDFIASRLVEARGYLVTYALGAELDIACYGNMRMNFTLYLMEEVECNSSSREDYGTYQNKMDCFQRIKLDVWCAIDFRKWHLVLGFSIFYNTCSFANLVFLCVLPASKSCWRLVFNPCVFF